MWENSTIIETKNARRKPQNFTSGLSSINSQLNLRQNYEHTARIKITRSCRHEIGF